MSADTDIANLALGRLGVGIAISSLAEQSAPARLCARFYHQCRKEVLRAHPWGFSMASDSLAELDDQTFPGWMYVYQYPQSCLMVRYVGDESGLRVAQTALTSCNWREWNQLQRRFMPFQVALKSDGASRVLLSDVPDAMAFFTYDVTNTAVFPVDFSSTFAWRLAMEVGGPLQADLKLIVHARNEYLFWGSHSTAQDMNERRDDDKPESPSVACRN